MPNHLYEIVTERARRYPNAIALGSQHGLVWQSLDSGQMLERVDRLAAEVAARGVGEGDRVVLWLPNHAWTALYHFALWKLGAIAVPFDREMNAEGAARIIAAVEPRLVLVGYGERPSWARGDAAADWWEPGSHGGQASGDWRPPGEELAVISFTSGTTGAPKGCMITHANLLSQVAALTEIIPAGPDCRLASILPLSHLLELTVGLLYPLAQGAAVHYVPSRRAPDIIRVFSEQHITHMVAVPQLLTAMGQALEQQLTARLPAPAYRALSTTAERLPLSARRLLFRPIHRRLGGQVRVFGSGGAALPPETHRLWERLGVRVIQGYGASECSPIITGGRADGRTPIGSVGRPLREVAVRFSESGELLVRGPNVMRGYWRDPERTAAALVDGWYATGDLGTADGDGNIWLLGRAKEMIVLPSGMKVWPTDIEAELTRHPAVKDAAVVSAPATSGGMTLHAYLLPADETATATDPRAVIGAANAHLAVHQRVATASWWPEADFPRTTTLKLRRHLLPAPDAASLAGGVPPPVAAPMLGGADLDPVAQAVASVARIEQVSETATLGELGLDSLALVQLALTLEEKTGVAVADDDLRSEMTVAEVRTLVGQAPAITTEVASVHRARHAEGDDPPRWAYRATGRAFRCLSVPFDLLYRLGITRTIVLGGEHLRDLPTRLVLAGTHHGWPDFMVIRAGLRQVGHGHLVSRLVIPSAASVMTQAGPGGRYAMLAFGLFPLRQYRDQEGSLRLLASIAGEGNPVLIFPQGHHADPVRERTGDPATAFKAGATHIARALEATVMPFGLAGTERVIPPTAEGFRGPVIAGIPLSITRGPVAVAFGAPLTALAGETTAAFTQRLQAACFALTRQAERAVAASPRPPTRES